jgi:hypothetical protein
MEAGAGIEPVFTDLQSALKVLKYFRLLQIRAAAQLK